MGSGFISDNEASESESDSSDSDRRAYRRKKRVEYSPTDYKNKEDSAEDYFDINELADEAPAEEHDPRDDYDDIEQAIPAAKVSADGTDGKSDLNQRNGDASDDKNLMPPPPQNLAPSVKQEDSDGSDSKSKLIEFNFI